MEPKLQTAAPVASPSGVPFFAGRDKTITIGQSYNLKQKNIFLRRTESIIECFK